MTALPADIGQPGRIPTGPRTIVLGYVAAVIVAAPLVMLLHEPLNGRIPRLLDADMWAAISGMEILPALLLGVPAFVAARMLCGQRFLSTAPRAIWGGMLTAVLINILVTVLLCLLFGEPRSIPRALMGGMFLIGMPVELLSSGAIGGLVFWLIEYSPLPTMLWRIVRDRRPARRAAVLLAAVAAACFIALGVHGFNVATAPKIDASRAHGLPGLVLRESRPFHQWTERLTWSPDSNGLISVPLFLPDQTPEMIVRHDDISSYDWKTSELSGLRRGSVTDTHVLYLGEGGTTQPPELFRAYDLQTGTVVHAEPDPDPEPPPYAKRWQLLALSADGAVLAAAQMSPGIPHPLSLFATREWTRLALPDLPLDRDKPIGPIALSADGAIAGLVNGNNFIAVNTRTGSIFPVIPEAGTSWVSAPGMALSPDGTMVALLTGPNPHVIKVFRLEDGQEIAHQVAGYMVHTTMAWDPLGRFLAFIDDDGPRVDQEALVRLWCPTNPDLGETVIHFRASPVMALAASPDGRHLAVTTEGRLYLFDIH